MVEQPRRTLRLRVDLHGVSVFGPADEHTAIRWEWIDGIDAGTDAVVVRSADAEVALPRGAFGLAPDALAEQLQRGRSIVDRPDVIGELARGAG